MDCTISFRNVAAAVHVYDARFVWLMLIAVITECTGLERRLLELPPNYYNDYNYFPQHYVLIDPWISPSTNKNTNSNIQKSKNWSDKLTAGDNKIDIEKYNKGKQGKEEKLTKYDEEKGKDEKFNDKGDNDRNEHNHKGIKKKVKYKKGNKEKKFVTKKGFRDKYHKNEKHKVNNFWDNFETYGTFKKIGKKSNLKLEGFKKNKKKKAKNEKRAKIENKKKGETQKKSGSKEEMGFNKEKKSDSHYKHDSEYHKKNKSKKRHKTKT